MHQPGRYGLAPLHIDSCKHKAKVCNLLLEHGAPVNQTTESGRTPLHLSFHFSYRIYKAQPISKVVKVLLWHGGRCIVIKRLLRCGATCLTASSASESSP